MLLPKIICSAGFLLFLPYALAAQQRPLSITEAVAAATQAPRLAVLREQSNASMAGVSQVKNTLVPELTAGYQAGYATYNNITGMSYPGLFLPISGPPSAGNTYDGVPGTALTALLKWEPLTFGQRQAAAEKASSQYQLAVSQYNEALFRQQYSVISAYLDGVYLLTLMKSYRANIERTQTGLGQSLVLAREGLRPGIDTVQFQSALAQAETDLLTLELRYYEQLAEIVRLTGLPAGARDISLTDTAFIGRLPQWLHSQAQGTHPAIKVSEFRLEAGKAALKEVQREWRPRFDVWANAYARGSGVAADGTVTKADGWSLTRRNYGAGVQLSFPILGFTQQSIRKKQYRSLLRADEAQLEQTKLDLKVQMETAQLHYDQNGLIARKAFQQAAAAQLAFDGLKISYESGLVDYTRLMQGQFELLRSEALQAGAVLKLWRSVLDMAVAQGSLDLFTNTLK
ncbi:TolC family protein [Chitinophaga sp. YIM B06452]|uniref:TolC family protein n=1 Tax=Chitinophaga sp. YIM B06452 TaxID=3082158 RepID=UPI0031FF0FC0